MDVDPHESKKHVEHNQKYNKKKQPDDEIFLHQDPSPWIENAASSVASRLYASDQPADNL
jgi:hypothetical protein